MPKVTKPKVTNEYKLTMHVFANKLTSTGSTPKEALENIVYKGMFPTKGILSMTHGDRKTERVINRVTGNRLFSLSPLMREVALKTVSSLFEGL